MGWGCCYASAMSMPGQQTKSKATLVCVRMAECHPSTELQEVKLWSPNPPNPPSLRLRELPHMGLCGDQAGRSRTPMMDIPTACLPASCPPSPRHRHVAQGGPAGPPDALRCWHRCCCCHPPLPASAARPGLPPPLPPPLRSCLACYYAFHSRCCCACNHAFHSRCLAIGAR